ncbi:ROK family glucokinase [Glycomyces buryatensis]|uniref:Glucokinase n=1 Tax=Glycomyces buryatensis TaxID=2570927 RepID=A0A4S8Q9R7_9ACTN|nr:ROK family glucokinase [Glycomyces buryatensis]THV39485.1 ROK family glucokinase [Glycomyces buryatensis]
MSLTIGVDIGGTKVGGGLVDATGNVLATARRPTPADDTPGVIQAVKEVVDELRAGHEIEAVGIGAAGWISSDRSTVMLAPNLSWKNEPLRDKVSEAIGLPAVVENDANVAIWGEHRYGAAKGHRSSVLYTIGTGVGGGIVVKDNLLRGTNGVAAEIGHMRVVPDGRPCGCGRHGCLEQYASGRALTQAARDGAKADPTKARVLLKLAGGDPDAITGRQTTEAAREGDEVALAAFDSIGYYLGNSAADMVNLIDPGVILIAGGVVDAGDLLLDPIRKHYKEALAHRAEVPVAEVRAAELGSKAGVIGASDLARHREDLS